MNIEAIKCLADRLAAEDDPNFKDEWERGYDFGRVTAGRELQKLLKDKA